MGPNGPGANNDQADIVGTLTPEGVVKKKLKALLDEWGAYYFMPVQTGYGKAGVDFFVCASGRFFAVEAKKKGVRKPTDRQADTMEMVKKAGGECYVVTMDEKEDLIWLKQ